MTEERTEILGSGSEHVTETYWNALAPADHVSNGKTVTLQYDAPVSDLLKLDETNAWQSGVRVLVNGVLVNRGTVTKALLKQREISVGKCKYHVWDVEDRLDLGNGNGNYFVQVYAPDLGLILSSIKMGSNGNPINGVQFDKIGMGPG